MTKQFLFAGVAAATLIAAPAVAQTYTGGTASFTGLGANADHPGTPFDEVSFAPGAGTYTGYGTYTLNTASFLAGENAYIGDPVHFTGSLGGLFATVGAQPIPYSVNYVLDLGKATDTITLGGNSYVFGSTKITINPLTLSNDGSAPSVGALTFTSGAVPEPATWAMMLLGFGMVGFGMRYRRKSQTTKVSFA